MAEEQAAKTGESQNVQLNVINQYTRDFSFENIAAQKALQGELRPEISVQVNLDARKVADEQYEVVLKLNVVAKADQSEVFLLELEYAGMFLIKNVPEEQIHPVLMIECPRLLFPFARRIIRDTVADGGFPPLNVDNVDFLALYRQELQRRMGDSSGADKPLN
ncbi:MAG: protein-export chaperone SecB [Pseudomonadota bacterium]